MDTAGTFSIAMPFCRRASRKRDAGEKTDGFEACLLSGIGGVIIECGPWDSRACSDEQRG